MRRWTRSCNQRLVLFVLAAFVSTGLTGIASPTTAGAQVWEGSAQALVSSKKKRKRKRKKRRKRRRKRRAKKKAAIKAQADAEPAAQPVEAEQASPDPASTTETTPPAASSTPATGAQTVPVEVAPSRQAPSEPTYEGQSSEPILVGGRAMWEGFFLAFNIGYVPDTGGNDGPIIPDPRNSRKVLHIGGLSPNTYGQLVTTNRGAGLGANLQIGYNIKGYVSFWGDIAWHGSFGSKLDTAGVGTVSAMLGLHPLRFWRRNLDYDVRLYGGYGIFEILYYYETVSAASANKGAQGKSWTGRSTSFGLSGEYRIPDSVFAIGLDLRWMMGAYDRWIWNYDDDLKSTLNPTVDTFRFEPRVIFAWHF